MNSMLNKLKSIDGRSIIFAYIFIYFFLLITVININGYDKGLRSFDIPPMVPIFADLYVIAGAHETITHGGNPYIENPHDPWHRVYNYPPILLILGDIGLTKNTVIYVGTAMALFFFLVLLFLFGRLSIQQGFYCALVTGSSATALAIERGNIDLLIFILIVACSYFFSHKDKQHNYFAGLVLFLASIIKLYPVFALISIVNMNKTKILKIGLTFVFLFFLYLILISNELNLIFENTPKELNRSFGSAILPAYFFQFWIPEIIQDRSRYVQFSLIAGNTILFILCAIIFYTTYQKRKYDTKSIEPENNFHLYSFQSGSIIFIGTFLLGFNFDYRLIFLLLTVPQLLNWYKTSSLLHNQSLITLGLILALMQWNFVSFEWLPRIFIFNEISSWVLVGFLWSLILKSLPARVFNWNHTA